MAEEAPGNHLNVNVKDRSIGLTTQQLPFVLFLVIVAILGYYRIKTHDQRLQMIDTHIQTLYTQQDTQNKEFLTLLRENRDVTGAKMDLQNDLLREQTEEMRRHHAIQIWNQGKDPKDHLMLDLPLPREHK